MSFTAINVLHLVKGEKRGTVRNLYLTRGGAGLWGLGTCDGFSPDRRPAIRFLLCWVRTG